MNELQVSVQQQQGIIKWNFDEIKAVCQQEMETYKKLVFTDADIKTAKSKLTELRKYRTQVEGVRKGVKAECLKPYDAFEKQSKELVGIIDEPINLISKQVAEYEASRKKQQREAILSYMDERFAPFAKELADRLKRQIYDSRWENLTAKKSDWQPAIDAKAAAVLRDVQVLGGIEEEFRGEAEKVYYSSLALSDALARVEELRRVKARIIEAERRRAAEEAEAKRRKAEEDAATQEYRARLEKAAREAEQAAQVQKEPDNHFREAPKMVGDPTSKNMPHTFHPVESPATIRVQQVTRAAEALAPEACTVKLYGNGEQIKKILAYAKYIGASYKMVEVSGK